MRIDGFDGERWDPAAMALDHLLEVRQQTVAAMVEAEMPGREYWRDQLNEIDYHLRGYNMTPAEHPLNAVWRNYTIEVLDALKWVHYRKPWGNRTWEGLPHFL